jgi:hypothetical protein
MRNVTLVAMLLILLFACSKDIDVTQLKTETVSSATKGEAYIFH